MSDARVVLIMPVFNEARHLPHVLESIGRQTFEQSRMFIAAVDGGSTDGSADILRAWIANSKIAGCVAVNPNRKIPISLNIGLQYAGDNDIVMRLDAHTVYGETYIVDAVRALEDAPPDVACVGCAQRPVAGSSLQERVVGALYTNPMGLGGTDFRCGNDVREVDNIYLGTWRPGILQRMSGFNETMDANEDAELSARLRKSGYRILRVPLPCKCFMKRTIAGSIHQWHRYGYWRAKMLRRNPEFIRLRHVVNPAAALATCGLAFSPLRVVLLPAFGIYAVLIWRSRSKSEPLATTLVTLAYFPVLQFGFAAGMLRGLLSGAAREWPAAAGVGDRA